jgi:hypothetical protein
MVVVDERRHRRDLHGVSIVRRVLEQAVVGVEQLPRQQEEELPRRTSVVQTLLVVPHHAQLPLLQLLLVRRHDPPEGVFQQVLASYVQPRRQKSKHK